MNREIKFRFWTGADMKCRFDGWGEHVCINEMFQECDGAFDYNVMQYTGLKDKNGKEIYEGDVVQTNNISKGVVSWSSMASQWWVRQGMTYMSLTPDYGDGQNYCQYLEVIGNIHENPELLK